MKHLIIFGLIIILIIGTVYFIDYYFKSDSNSRINKNTASVSDNTDLPDIKTNPISGNNVNQESPKPFFSPIADGLKRISKKPFGLYITPKTSPVQPERFTGYHAGADFETFSNEAAKEIEIKAICDGTVIYKSRVAGYGGVMVEACNFDKNPVTVLYGHLNLSETQVSVGQSISAGEILAPLGNGFSTYTDGERKHLHLSIYKGSHVELRGYVQNQNELNIWYNPADLIDFEK